MGINSVSIWRNRFCGDFMDKQKEMDQLRNLFNAKGFLIDPLLKDVVERYPFRISTHVEEMLLKSDSSLWRQIIPSLEEIKQTNFKEDPFDEKYQSPVPNLIHRYPDRVLLLTTDECAMYCRFCFRKRRAGKNRPALMTAFDEILKYIQKHSEIEEVILSGGDPLTLSDVHLDEMLREINKVSHVEIIRIHTRMLTANPNRITTGFVQRLKKYKPLYIITHFNAVDEITSKTIEAANQLIEAGIVLGNQSVLLKGVNDSSQALSNLWRKLVKIRIRPYYLHHPDPVAGTSHFRVSIPKGLKIYNEVRSMSGLCVPRYVVDLPGATGKRVLSSACSYLEKDIILSFQNSNEKEIEHPDAE